MVLKKISFFKMYLYVELMEAVKPVKTIPSFIENVALDLERSIYIVNCGNSAFAKAIL